MKLKLRLQLRPAPEILQKMKGEKITKKEKGKRRAGNEMRHVQKYENRSTGLKANC